MAKATMPSPMKNTYIHDFANVLSASIKEQLNHYSAQLDQGTGAEIMIVTIDSLDGQEPKMYATKMIRSWGIGDEQKNNGVLILATFGQGEGNNDVVIAVGQGLEGPLPDGKLGRILDEAFYPSASTGDIDQAFQSTYAEIFRTVAKEYNWNGELPAAADEGEDMPTWLIILIVLVALIIYTWWRSSCWRLWWLSRWLWWRAFRRRRLWRIRWRIFRRRRSEQKILIVIPSELIV